MHRSQVSLTVAALGLLILTGCSSSVTPIEVKYSPVKQVQLNLPKVEELKLDPVDWHVINQNNQEEVFKNLEKKNYDPALMGLTDKGYENLSVNLTKILTVMEQQRLTIEAVSYTHLTLPTIYSV